MGRAILLAIAILVAGDALFLAAIKLSDGPGALFVLIWSTPAVAAFATSWTAPKHKFIGGLSVAIPAAIFMGLSNFAFETVGNPVDLGGIQGALFVMGMSLPMVVLACTIGALAGSFASKRKANA